MEEICAEAVGLLMTYRCNFRCKYCYIREKQAIDMSLDTAKSILVPFLMKNEGLLNIAFMGGEPFLVMDIIKPLVEWVESGSWNRKYRFFGSTNGSLLSKDIKDWLREHRNVVTFGLSFDGIPEIQVANRASIDVDIDFFISTWPNQPIQMTINEDSVNHMAEGVIYLLEKGAIVHPNVAYEEHEWSDKNIAEYGRQLNNLITYYRNHPEKPLVSAFIHNIKEYVDCLEIPHMQKEICGAGNGFQVFDIDRVSYPCHILSPLVLRGTKLACIKKDLVKRTQDFSDSRCNSCPYILSCPSCMACNFLYRGSLQKRDYTHCQIMKKEVRAFIKKEILRLRDKEILSPVDAAEVDALRKIWMFEYKKNQNDRFT